MINFIYILLLINILSNLKVSLMLSCIVLSMTNLSIFFYKSIANDFSYKEKVFKISFIINMLLLALIILIPSDKTLQNILALYVLSAKDTTHLVDLSKLLELY